MIKLVPEWAYDYDAFWKSMRSRNLWFIYIRYGAVLALAILFQISNYSFKINLSELQSYLLLVITAGILLYNILLHSLRKYLKNKPGKFNSLHFSLLQIILDLSALMMLVYFTGGIESPLYLLFIFHMIIGSLILPSYVILSIAFIVSISFSGMIYLDYFKIIPHFHLNGIHEFELHANTNYIISNLGVFIFTIFTSVLITSKIAKRLYNREKELIEMLKKLDEAEKAKQKYTMAVVHEIKSPIVAAQSIIEIIKNGYLGEVNEKVKEKLERTTIRTNEALKLINNILRISKLKLLGEVTIEKVNLVKIVNDIIDQKREIIQKKNIELTIDSEGFDNELIDGDTILFELILSNILGNAIKYNSQNGMINVLLKSEVDKVFIDISDSGIGIPENEINMIYRQFYRASNLPSKNIEGSGLGLSLVKEIVERLNGTIYISSPSIIGKGNYPGTSVQISLLKTHE